MKISVSMLKSLWLFLVMLLVLLGNDIPFPLLALFVLVALAVPLMREFSRQTQSDERQKQIGHFSSHIAYFVFSGLLLFVLIKNFGGKKNSIFLLLLLLPMLIKMAICLIQSYGLVKGFKNYVLLFCRGIIKIKSLDERQNYIGNFSSHIAFYTYVAALLFYIIINFSAQQQQPGTIWYMLLLMPLMAKLLASLFYNYGAAKGARLILYVISGFWLLFALLSHGISLGALIEAIPFLVFLAVALLSQRFPLIAGFIIIALAMLVLFYFSGWSRFDIYLRLLMYSLIPFPIALCGAAFLVEYSNKRNAEVQE